MKSRSDWFGQWYRSGRLSQHLLLLASAVGAVSLLLTARALVALAPVVAVVAALLNPDIKQALPSWWRNRSARRLAVLYLLMPLTWWYTQDWPVWRHEVYRQLPLIGVPLAFCLAVPLSARQRFGVGALFVTVAAAVGLATVGRYLADPAAANQLIDMGQNVTSVTGIFHIHFGIILALASFFGVTMSREALVGRLGRWGLLIAAAAAAISLHVLAYRTGLWAFYVGVFGSVFFLVRRRPVWAGLLLLIALALPAGAYFSFQSVRQQINTTRYDLERYSLGYDVNDFSVSKRLIAWKTAQIIAEEHPLLGVAPADVRQAMMAQYAWRSYGLLPENRVMIHNQYLHYLVGAGVVGLLVWLWVLAAPLWQPELRRNPYVRHFLLIFGAAALVDSLLELQISFNLFVFLYGFIIVAHERRTRFPDVTQ